MADKQPGKKKRKPRLTQKQRRFAQLIAAGIPQQQAAVTAGYSSKNPSQSATQVLNSISNRFPDLMDRHGLTDSVLIERHLKPLLKAKRTKHFAHNGKVKSARHYADNDTRLAALDMSFRLKGSYAPVKTEAETKYIDRIIVDLPRPKKITQQPTDIEVSSSPEKSV
jgi:hypothetical protein